MLLLSLAQSITHIVAPAAKPPARLPVPIVSKKDNSVRKKRTLSENVATQEQPTNHRTNPTNNIATSDIA
ncbi:MAG: hypothetical protein KTR27_21360 [Leptolyngbyaceae cyanobacterium MAG.088]|nr:hypothetical protein [Leptolyngbyaceae cyanobacterium MAG.088]